MKKAKLGILMAGIIIAMAFSSLIVNAAQVNSEQKTELELMVTGGKPDLIVVYITNLDTIEEDKSIEYEVQIKNIGEATAEGRFETRVFKDSILAGSDYTSNLKPGETHTFTFKNYWEWWGSDSKDLDVYVDWNYQIDEHTEGNNHKEQMFELGDEPGTGKTTKSKTVYNQLIFEILEKFSFLAQIFNL